MRIEARSDGVRSGLGSGWVLDAREGLVVTAAHVVNRGQLFYAGEKVTEVVGVSPCEDLALLRVDGGLGGASLAFGGAGRGDSVVALGYPATAEAGDPASPTRGIVAADHARLPDPSPEIPSFPHALQSDTVLDPGFSGGPLLDLDGHVAGVDVAVRGRRAYAVSAGRRERACSATCATGGRAAGWAPSSSTPPTPTSRATAIRRGSGSPACSPAPAPIAPACATATTSSASTGARSGRRSPAGAPPPAACASGQLAQVGIVRGNRSRETVPVRFD